MTREKNGKRGEKKSCHFTSRFFAVAKCRGLCTRIHSDPKGIGTSHEFLRLQFFEGEGTLQEFDSITAPAVRPAKIGVV